MAASCLRHFASLSLSFPAFTRFKFPTSIALILVYQEQITQTDVCDTSMLRSGHLLLPAQAGPTQVQHRITFRKVSLSSPTPGISSFSSYDSFISTHCTHTGQSSSHCIYPCLPALLSTPFPFRFPCGRYGRGVCRSIPLPEFS